MNRFASKAFDPDTLVIIEAAFEDACTKLKQIRQDKVSRDALAQRILEFAGAGERDPARLSARAVAAIIRTEPQA